MNSSRILMLVSAGFLAVGCLDTARADTTLSVTPTALTFTNVPANSTATQQVQVSANVATSVVIQVSPASPWLTVSPSVLNVGTSGSLLNVKVNTQGLMQGNYSGSFTISINGSTTNQQTVSVVLSVSGTSLLSANPASLSFSALQGASSGTPASTTVQIASSGAALQYTIQASTTDGHNWLLLNSTTGTTGDAGFAVSVNPSVLPVGMYTGTITAMSNSTNDSVQIPVTLTVNANATTTVTPSTLPPFLWQVGTPDPASQQLMVSATGGTASFSVRVSPTVAWLVVSPLNGQAGTSPAVLNLSVTPKENALNPGLYSTSVIVTPTGGADLPPVNVSLVVSANPLLQLSKTALSYSGQFASAQGPPDQQVMVTASNAGTVGFTFSSDQPWLTASTSASSTPATFTIHVNPSNLAVNNYTGHITIQPSNGDQYTQVITVSLAVTATSSLTAGPADLLFSFQTGQSAPPPQSVQIGSTGQPIPFTITTTTATCGNWLSASSNSNITPATLTVNATTTGLTAGTCSGTITLNYNSGSGAASLPIMVTLAVSNASELSISLPTNFGVETVAQGSGGFTRQIALTSTDPNTPVTFSASATSTPGGWLLVGSSGINPMTPQNLIVQFLPSGLTPGSYTGTITISSPSLGATQLTIPVMLTVTSNVTVAVSPVSLTFAEAQGGSPPASQNLTLTSTGGSATFTSSIQYNNGSGWLQVSPASGAATGTVAVSVLPNTLSQGTYTATITLALQGAATTQVVVPVTLNVGPPQTVSVSATALSFSYALGGTQPASQAITVSSTGSTPVAFTVGTTSSGWLSVDTTSGTTPKTINVSVNTASLGVGPNTGSITISAPGVLATPITIPVTLTVTSAAPPQLIKIFNSASGLAGLIAPGEIITITGNQLGPITPASFTVNSNQTVNSTLAGVQVLFDSIPGTPIYVSAGQINVVVPYEIAGRVSTVMTVVYNGQTSAMFPLGVQPVAPALYTINFSGTGQVAAINEDLSINGQGAGFAPAVRGKEISIYGTGGGQTNPASTSGTITPITANPSQLLRVPGTITATVGGLPAIVDFAGAAPGLITGAIQFNVHIPTGVTPGPSVPVTISINGVTTPIGTTIAVQ